MPDLFDRRTVLTALSSAAVGLAGCGGDSGDDQSTATGTTTATATETATATATETATATPEPSMSDWPTYQYSSGRLGEHPDAVGLSGAPSTDWTYDLGTPTTGSLTLVDGTLFVGAGSTASNTDVGGIHAIDAVSGEAEWTTDAGGPVLATPTVSDGLLFAGSERGTMYALNTAGGDTFWTYDLSGDVGFSTAAVTDDLVVSGTTGGRVLSLLRNSGGRRRIDDVASPVRIPVAYADGTAYIGTNSGEVNALAPTNAESWSYDEDRGIRGVATDGRAIYATSRGGNMFSLNTNGRLLWEFGTPSPVRHSPVVSGEWTYFATDTGEIYGLQDGLEAWKTEIDPAVTNSPVLVDGTLYFVGDDGTVFGLDPANGDVRWQYGMGVRVENSTPIVSGGRLWVPTLDGTVHSLVA